MHQRSNTKSNLGWIVFLVLVTSGHIIGKPNLFDPIEGVALLDPAKTICTAEWIYLCQQCAKKTESAVVYPWCCANHQNAREWCEHYLHFGLQ